MDPGKVNQDGQALYTEEWIHTNKTTRDRGKNVIHVTSAAERQN
ncbi:MAG TPA: hypothetical protein VJN92_11790 [Candidatus Acidoferrum sp.]|nr:hypothetical protein [Candidatus Acidoferrum sp.]